MGMDESVMGGAGESEARCRGLGKSTCFENVKSIIADKLDNLAGTLRKKANDPGAQSGKAQCGKRASEWLEQSAEYVRQFDYKQADARAQEYIRKNPGRSLLIAGAFGLIVGVVLRRR